MRRAYQFAGDHPIVFALLMLLLWLIVTAAAVILISLLFSLPLTAYPVQSLGTLATTVLLLPIYWPCLDSCYSALDSSWPPCSTHH